MVWFLLIFGYVLAFSVQAGGSCAVAKRQGDSLAVEWLAEAGVDAATAIKTAKSRLIDAGYRKKGQDVHSQASSNLEHGYLVLIKTVYQTTRNKPRTSYGCGFSGNSSRHAEEMAVYNLRNYSWAWKPEMGYEVVESVRF